MDETSGMDGWILKLVDDPILIIKSQAKYHNGTLDIMKPHIHICGSPWPIMANHDQSVDNGDGCDGYKIHCI